MSNYMTKAAAHARLLKLASAARLIRRQRALQKYAQAVQMQKAALSTGAQASIGAGLGGLIGGGIGYGLGKKDKKLLSALIGAGAGAGIGGLGGWGLGAYLNSPYRGLEDKLIANGTAPNKPIAKQMIADHKALNGKRNTDTGTLEGFSNADQVQSVIDNGVQGATQHPWVAKRDADFEQAKADYLTSGGDILQALKYDPEVNARIMEWAETEDANKALRDMGY